MNNTAKPFTENDDRSGTKCHKDGGIFDHAKPHNISSYYSRAAPSPHTLMRASAPPHLASPAHRVCAPCTPRPAGPHTPLPRKRFASRRTKADPDGFQDRPLAGIVFETAGEGVRDSKS